MGILENIEPKLVFKYFEEISNIPRGSGNEKEMSDYLVSFAKKHGLEVIQDEVLNIVIKKPASKGYENAPGVILQGHMDMVCEKNKDTVHDFTKDPIELKIDGDNIYANGTTLGGDDGIAVAYCMAILADDTIEHPSLEVLLTTDEETGMTGAENISPEHIDGKILLNIDSEEEGELLVSCAGGIRTRAIMPITWEDKCDCQEALEIKIKGLKGGHSGSDITKGRANSNKIMARLLKGISDKYDIRLAYIEGGAKDNAIPRESEAIITAKKEYINNIKNEIVKLEEIFKHEFKIQDPDLTIEVIDHEGTKKTFDKESTKKVITLLYLYPNGINTMSKAIHGLPESSTNIGVVETDGDKVRIASAVRSSVPSLNDEIVLRSKTLTETLGGELITEAPYPAWEYKEESKIREICKDVYKKMYGEDPKVVAIHAGVECGLFEERIGNLDMISFGPNIYDAHTPQEHMSIKSVKNVWEYLVNVLKEIK